MNLKIMKHISFCLILLFTTFSITSCIEPPLHLPGQEMKIILPEVDTDIDVAWDVHTDVQVKYHFGWDETDAALWDSLEYPMPKTIEVRRYYTGENPDGDILGKDGFTINTSSFRKYFQFGYYNMLFWSDVDYKGESPNVKINETNPDAVLAYTNGSKGFKGLTINGADEDAVIGLHDQPEMLYAAYPKDVHISEDLNDYEYDSINNVYIKHIEAILKPLVYVYLVQIILHNNESIVQTVDGNAAITSLASGVIVNTGHTLNDACMVYMPTRMKKDIIVDGEEVDIVGGRLNTFGLCDMERYDSSRGTSYQGGRTKLHNYVYFDLTLADGSVKTYKADVTDQIQKQAYGGIITIDVDCMQLEPEYQDDLKMQSLFLPTIEDYKEIVWHFEI